MHVSFENYQSYLLRFQRQGPNQPHWRATVCNVHTSEEIHFASEMEALQYLLKRLQDHEGVGEHIHEKER